MTKTTKKTFSILLGALVLLMSLSICFVSFAAEESGGCGSGLTWTYNDISKTLTISGSGSMNDYYTTSSGSTITAPWKSYQNSIVKVTVEEGVTTIGNYAFYKCSALMRIELPNSVESIGNHAAHSCSKLVGVKLGSGLQSIGTNAFGSCSALTSITLPDSLKTIGDYAFSSCSSLVSITIPFGVQTIGRSAFSSCNKLTSASIPDSVESIGNAAFSGCSKLTTVNIPNGLTSVEATTFYNCSSLSEITIPDSVQSIGQNAFAKSVLSKVAIGKNVVLIDNYAFSECKLAELALPENVETIGEYAFQKNNLSKVSMYSKVSTIGKAAFYYQNGSTNTVISDVYYYGTQDNWKDVMIGIGAQNEPLLNASFHFGGAPVHIHSYTSTVTITASCTNTGVRTYFCSCGQSYTETIAALGHNYVITVIPATCTASGYTLHKCSRCSANTKTNEAAALGHIDANNDGKCDRCKINYGHTHAYTATITKAATCSAKGVKTFACTCGDSYTEDIPLDPTNHVHTENRSGLAATCTETGYTAGVYCTDCGKWVSGHATVAIDNTNHAALDANGNCPRCGKHVKDVEKPAEPTTQPNNEPSEKELNFFERLIQMILNFFAKLFGR